MKTKRRHFLPPFLLCLIVNLIMLAHVTFASSVFAAEKDLRIVDLYGQLKVEGNQIVNQKGDSVALRGMSLFWSQWIGKYYNYDCVKWLRDDWKCTVVRAAMAVESGGYLSNPAAEMQKVKTVIDACIDLGIYVIIDWHDHNAHKHQAEAITFFKQIATLYGNKPNIIYEIYNEPEQVSWANVIKPYSEAVIREIRSIDADNIIIVGTPTWSQDVDVAATNPLNFENIAYALHFYAATHKQYLRNKALTALNKGLALFVSEYGTCESTGTGIIDYIELGKWYAFMDEHKLSWCNWSIADKNETSAALKSGASATGNWPSSDLSTSGALVREKIISWNEPILTSVQKSKRFNDSLKPDIIQNYPNPFNSMTHFQFYIPSPQRVTIDIYNILGEKVTSLLGMEMQAGVHDISFASDYLPSGIYFYKYERENMSQIRGMQLIK
ncbi:MAG TPA: cellulase family glycosylhydrolase [bacterium]